MYEILLIFPTIIRKIDKYRSCTVLQQGPPWHRKVLKYLSTNTQKGCKGCENCVLHLDESSPSHLSPVPHWWSPDDRPFLLNTVHDNYSTVCLDLDTWLDFITCSIEWMTWRRGTLSFHFRWIKLINHMTPSGSPDGIVTNTCTDCTCRWYICI